jgi:hypothetical protein
MPFEVIDTEKRAILREFATRGEAEAFRAELLAEDPRAEGFLIITSTGERGRPFGHGEDTGQGGDL